MSSAADPLPQLIGYLSKYFEVQGGIGALRTFGAVCCAVTVWDYLVTLPDEIEFIWLANFSYLNICVLVTRYWNIVTMALYTSFLTAPMASETCQRHVRVVGASAMMVSTLGNTIMTARLFSIWNRSLVILGFLICLMGAQFGLQLYVASTAVAAPVVPALPGLPIPQLHYCVPHGDAGQYLMYNSPSLAFDSIAFLLACIPLLKLWRSGVRSTTVKTLSQDGVLFFLLSLAANSANIIRFASIPEDTAIESKLLLPLGTCMHGIAVSRLVFSLRKAVKRGTYTTSAPSSDWQGTSSGRKQPSSRIFAMPKQSGETSVTSMPPVHYPHFNEGLSSHGRHDMVDVEVGQEKLAMQ